MSRSGYGGAATITDSGPYPSPFSIHAVPPGVSLLSGRASKDGTDRFSHRAVEEKKAVTGHFRLGPGGVTLSSFGLGTYLGAPDRETDLAVELAVRTCLASGRVNVIDTAINYRHQRAERSVGRAIAAAIDGGTVRRDEFFITTKNGYLAPDIESGLTPQRWLEEQLLRPGVLKRSEIVDGSHAMSVPYLEDQFERSRANLGLETIDGMYLHNAADAQLPVVGHEEFLARLREAFRLYERLRTDGRLVVYGLATWDCFRVPRSDPGYLSLAEVVRIAAEIGGASHGFRCIQFPFSLGMPEAAALRNQVEGAERRTLFDAAHRLGVHVFTSVPLQQGMLAQAGPTIDGLSAAQTALQFARSAPYTLGPMVGQKSPEHLSENLAVAERAPWTATEFNAALHPG